MQLPPLPQASLRDHRGTADGLHLPLHRLSADKQQRLLYRDCRGRECFSAQRYRAAIDPANGRWRAGQHSLGVPGVRLLGLRHPEDGLVRARAGTLDDTSWLPPTRYIWTRSKQPWITLPADDQIFAMAPPA